MHIPVLLNEILDIFNPKPGEIFIDATVNGGGHARAIAERVGEKGLVLGIDWDADLIKAQKEENQRLGITNITLVHANYADLAGIIREHNLAAPRGILLDLGFSSHHLEASGRGFSFMKKEPLDMRYDPKFNELTAKEIVNTWDQDAIEDILRTRGEERNSRRIAEGIVTARRHVRIETTIDLVEIISRSVGGNKRAGRIHTATRTFQALRITVNKELENLEAVLPQARDALAGGGVLAAISFHSLEDREVKNFLKDNRKELGTLTKKPIRASREEMRSNPRARSAKLRAAVKDPNIGQ